MHFPCPSLSLSPVLAKIKLFLVLLFSSSHFHKDLQKYFPEQFCDFKHILAGPATRLLGLVLAGFGCGWCLLLELEEWVGVLFPPPDSSSCCFYFVCDLFLANLYACFS